MSTIRERNGLRKGRQQAIDARLKFTNSVKFKGSFTNPLQCRADLSLMILSIWDSMIAVASQSSAAPAADENVPEFRHPFQRLEKTVKALVAKGQLLEAFNIYNSVLATQPNNPTFLYVIGMFFRDIGLPEEAFKMFEIVQRMDPEADYYINDLGHALYNLGRSEEGVAFYRDAIHKNPLNHHYWGNLGLCLSDIGDFERAIIFLEEAVRLEPDFPEAFANMAETLNYLNRSTEAIEWVRKAVASLPDRPQIRLNLGLTLLRLGDLKGGWDAYMARFDYSIPGSAIYMHDIPEYDGRTLSENETLLVCSEQGIGDQILYTAMLPDLLKIAPNILFETDARLVGLYQRAFPNVKVFARNISIFKDKAVLHYPWAVGENRPQWSTHIGSIARFLRPNLASFPSDQGPYMKPDPELAALWGKRLSEMLPPGLKVGFCWRSGLKTQRRSKFYMQIEQLKPFFQIPGIAWVNLQYDECSEELEQARQACGVAIYNPDDLDQKHNIEGTAALISNLDVVVSVATSVRTLAGAMAKPTLLMVPGNAWTSFGTGREYFQPSVHLYEAKSFGDWEGILSQVADELRRRVAAAGMN